MSEPIFQDPRFDALRNALYHTARGRFLDSLNRFFNFLVIVLGAAAVGKIAKVFDIEDYWIEGAIVVDATIQLVFDYGGRAATHVFLQKRYYDLLAEIETAPDIEGLDVKRKWSARLMTIAGDEPIPMRALDAVAYNTALDSQIHDPEELKKYRLFVPLWARLLKQIIAFQGMQFVPKSQCMGLFSRIKHWRANG